MLPLFLWGSEELGKLELEGWVSCIEEDEEKIKAEEQAQAQAKVQGKAEAEGQANKRKS